MMTAVDLFAGLGGFTEGAQQAGIVVLWAGNHWKAAVDTHRQNHPAAIHLQQDLQQADWRAVPRHDLLLASPACTGHTPARGVDRPHHDSSRSTAWAVVAALEYHRTFAAICENVPEFLDWVLYPAWCEALRAIGYALAVHQLDAADHGVPQHRKRVFIVLTRSRAPLMLKLPQREHVPISSVLDFAAGTWSPVRKPGRATSTIARVTAGRRRFGERFVMPFYGSGSGLTGRDINRPVGTITTRDRWALVDGDRMRMFSRFETRGAMGFRPDYILPDNHKLAMHMLGNAVPPPMVRDAITALRAAA